MDLPIKSYDHPYLTVDGVILRYFQKHLEVLLLHRQGEYPGWALPGGFVNIDQIAEDTLRRKVKEKTDFEIGHAEQLKTYDALDRDPRGRIISMAYLCLTHNEDESGLWFQIDSKEKKLTNGEASISFSDLCFDHGEILEDALIRLKGKLWWSDLPKYLLPERFVLRDIDGLFQTIEGKETNMLKRQLGKRIREVGTSNTRGRPAKAYMWVMEKDREGF